MILMENKPLAPFTTFGIGGPARWFVEAQSEEEIVQAAAWAEERGVRLFVLGGGSNLLVSDAGFDGLALRVGLLGIVASATPDEAESSTDADRVIYQAAAGEDWDRFVERTVQDRCAGVECLAGIPGTVGGTPVQNVGAYGQEVASAIERVRAFDLVERRFVEFHAAECGFGYRRSRFNTMDRERFIVTRVDFRLSPGGAPSLRYAELQRAILEGGAKSVELSVAEVAAAVRLLRRSKGMLIVEGDPDCRSAGSFFKNPVVSGAEVRRIAEKSGLEPPCYLVEAGAELASRASLASHPSHFFIDKPRRIGHTDSSHYEKSIGMELKTEPCAEKPLLFKVPAAWLIEQAGFNKGYALGAAAVSSRHTLALVNRGDRDGKGGASAAEVRALAGLIVARVEDRFGIRLETEPVMVGF
jgi:UDP-N-acetylmuramate dehydrogenase